MKDLRYVPWDPRNSLAGKLIVFSVSELNNLFFTMNSRLSFYYSYVLRTSGRIGPRRKLSRITLGDQCVNNMADDSNVLWTSIGSVNVLRPVKWRRLSRSVVVNLVTWRTPKRERYCSEEKVVSSSYIVAAIINKTRSKRRRSLVRISANCLLFVFLVPFGSIL